MVHLGRNDYHEKDSEKEFCISTGSGFHRSYLIVLLQSDSLFNSGMTHIFHGQSKSYYDAILSLSGMGCAQDLKANRPVAEYKDLVKKVEAESKKGASRQGKEKRTRDPSASDLYDLPEEPEVNFLSLPSKPEVAEAKQSKTGRTGRKILISKKRAISISASDDSDKDDSALANAVAVPSQGAGFRQRKKQFNAKAKQDQKDAHGSTAEGDAGSQPGLEFRKKRNGIGSIGIAEKEDEVTVKTEKAEVLKAKDCTQPFQEEVMSIVSSDEDAGSAKRVEQSKQSGHPQEAVGASGASASDPQEPAEQEVPVPVLPPEEHPSQVGQELSSGPSSSSRAASSRDVPSERPVAVEAPVGHASSTSHGAAKVAKATKGSERAPSALFNLSTVWLGDIPVVQRVDKGTDSWKTIHFVTVTIHHIRSDHRSIVLWC